MTDKNPAGWTFGTLTRHYDERFKAQEEAVRAALAASEKAVLKAEMAAEKRFDSVNEFRNAMADQQATFANKEQTDFRLTAIDKKLAEGGGKTQGLGIAASIVINILTIGLIILGLFLRH